MKVLLYPQESNRESELIIIWHFHAISKSFHIIPGWIIENVECRKHISYIEEHILSLLLAQKIYKLPLSFVELNEILPFLSTFALVFHTRSDWFVPTHRVREESFLYENWWFRVSAQLCIHLFCNRLLRFFTLFNFSLSLSKGGWHARSEKQASEGVKSLSHDRREPPMRAS